MTWLSLLFLKYTKHALYLKYTSVLYTHWNAPPSNTCMAYSSMSFRQLFKRVLLTILSKIVAIYCNCPTPYPGLFYFIAYINTPNITLFISYIFSHQILVFECLLCVKLSVLRILEFFSPKLELL